MKKIALSVILLLFVCSCGKDDYDIPDQRESFESYFESRGIDYVEQNGVFKQTFGAFPRISELGEQIVRYGEAVFGELEEADRIEMLDSLADAAASHAGRVISYGEYLVRESSSVANHPDVLEETGYWIAVYADSIARVGVEIYEWAVRIEEEAVGPDPEPGEEDGEDENDDEDEDGEEDDPDEDEEEEPDDTVDRMKAIGANLYALAERIYEIGIYIIDKKDQFSNSNFPVAEEGDRVAIYYSIYQYRSNTGPSTLYWTNIRSDAETVGFDQTFMDFEPEEFTLGDKGMMKGINLGLPGSLQGDSVYLYITSDLGYHTRTTGVVPKNTPLVVKVVLDRVTKN